MRKNSHLKPQLLSDITHGRSTDVASLAMLYKVDLQTQPCLALVWPNGVVSLHHLMTGMGELNKLLREYCKFQTDTKEFAIKHVPDMKALGHTPVKTI